MHKSSVIIINYESLALRDNPLGDPSDRSVGIYLPPEYNRSDLHYPCVYMLSAFTNRGINLLNDALWEENIKDRLDRLITDEKIRPMIMVLPDASTRYGGSQYLNSTATGNYEDHILELVEYIDANYRTVANSSSRAVMGHSSGGYGATMLAMKHPDIFGLLADHSGDKFFELAYQPEFGDFLRHYERVGDQGILNLLLDPGKSFKNGVPFSVLSISAMASCYSPNPDSLFGFDLPFDLSTGELKSNIWDKWLSYDPVNLVENYAKNLSTLKLLFFDCGKYDEYNLLFGCRQFANKLKAHDILFRFDEYEDGHRNVAYRYDVSLAVISEAFA